MTKIARKTRKLLSSQIEPPGAPDAPPAPPCEVPRYQSAASPQDGYARHAVNSFMGRPKNGCKSDTSTGPSSEQAVDAQTVAALPRVEKAGGAPQCDHVAHNTVRSDMVPSEILGDDIISVRIPSEDQAVRGPDNRFAGRRPLSPLASNEAANRRRRHQEKRCCPEATREAACRP